MDRITIDLSEATDRQLLLAIYRNQLRMEPHMTDLDQALADLTVAVDRIGTGLLPVIQDLQAQLAAARAGEEGALEKASAAADTIESQVAELNAIDLTGGTDPDPDPEPDPEPSPDPEPEPDPGVPPPNETP